MILRQKFHYGIAQPSNYNPDRIPEIIEQTHRRLARVQIESLPYEQVLHRYDRPETCFYLDPPYWRRKLYKFNFSDSDFQNLDQHLRALKGKFILSLDDHPEVRKLFGHWTLIPVDIAYTAKRDATVRHRELLIMNFDAKKSDPEGSESQREITPHEIRK